MATEEVKEEDIPTPRANRASIAALDIGTAPTERVKFNADGDAIPVQDEIDETEMLGALPKQLDRAHSLDTGLNAQIVSMATMETITVSKSQGSEPKSVSETVIIPPRKVLSKYPFYSTPQSLEATNFAYREFKRILTDMGYGEQAEAALVATNVESVEMAVDFIDNHQDQMYHRFEPETPKDSNENPDGLLVAINHESGWLCALCGMKREMHIIDEKGNAIPQKDPFAYDELENMLQHKVQMIAGAEEKQQRPEPMRSDLLQQIIATASATTVDTSAAATTSNATPTVDTTGPTQTCMICFDDVSMDMFHSAPCGHDYCKTCLTHHYKVKTNDGDVLKVSCIDPKCDRLIEQDEILTFLVDPDVRAKFIKFREQKLAMLTPNLRFCCKPDCPGTMTGSRIQRKLICPICSTAVCFNCSQPWHGYFVGCNQNVDIGYSKWALNKDVQKCPKCRMGIEKADGCNHMTCSSCRYEFCWICKGPYTSSHFEPWNIFGCPGAQYTPRFCRCPSCFPRWLNRIVIILCFLAVVIPLGVAAGTLWVILMCIMFCVRCDFKCEPPCDL